MFELTKPSEPVCAFSLLATLIVQTETRGIREVLYHAYTLLESRYHPDAVLSSVQDFLNTREDTDNIIFLRKIVNLELPYADYADDRKFARFLISKRFRQRKW